MNLKRVLVVQKSMAILETLRGILVNRQLKHYLKTRKRLLAKMQYKELAGFVTNRLSEALQRNLFMGKDFCKDFEGFSRRMDAQFADEVKSCVLDVLKELL